MDPNIPPVSRKRIRKFTEEVEEERAAKGKKKKTQPTVKGSSSHKGMSPTSVPNLTGDTTSSPASASQASNNESNSSSSSDTTTSSDKKLDKSSTTSTPSKPKKNPKHKNKEAEPSPDSKSTPSSKGTPSAHKGQGLNKPAPSQDTPAKKDRPASLQKESKDITGRVPRPRSSAPQNPSLGERASKARALAQQRARQAQTQMKGATTSFFKKAVVKIGAPLLIVIVAVVLIVSILAVAIVASFIDEEEEDYVAPKWELGVNKLLPPDYHQAFKSAAAAYDVPYGVLAGLAYVQTDFGRGVQVDGIDRDPHRPTPMEAYTDKKRYRKGTSKHSVYNIIIPAIGDTDNSKGVGLYLFAPKEHGDADPQNVNAVTSELARQLAEAAKNIERSGELKRPKSTAPPEELDAFWALAVNQLKLMNGSSEACPLSDPPPTGPDLIKTIFDCEFQKATQLNVVEKITDVNNISTVSRVRAQDIIRDDAYQIAYWFSDYGQAPCDENSDEPQGMFPLPKGLTDSRCDPIMNTKVAAAAIVEAFSQPVTPTPDVPYSALFGGWSLLPTVVARDTPGSIGLRAPFTAWEPSEACSTAMKNMVQDAIPDQMDPFLTSEIDIIPEKAAEVISHFGNSPVRLETCGSPSMQSWNIAMIKTLAEYQGFLDVAPTDTDKADVREGEDAALKALQHQKNKIADGLTSVYTANAQLQRPTPGQTPLLQRFSSIQLDTNDFITPSVNIYKANKIDLGTKVVQASLPFGGTSRDDTRVAEAIQRYITTGAASAGSAMGITSSSSVDAIAAATQIDRTVVDAYVNASNKSGDFGDKCKVSWALPATIGFIETKHATYGGKSLPTHPNGDLRANILSNSTPPAEGLMQFQGPTWKSQGKDGNGDGKAESINVYDAAYSTVNYLCALRLDKESELSDPEVLRSVSRAYYGGPGGRYWKATEGYGNNAVSIYNKYLSIPVETTAMATNPGGFIAPMDKAKFISPFGPRTHPIRGSVLLHTGVDLVKPKGTPVRAVKSGVVTWAGNKDPRGYGNEVDIKHDDHFSTKYAHLDSIAVSNGQQVNQGDVIGYEGSTGGSTGPHLHFETRVNGVPQDPLVFYGSREALQG